MCLISLCTSDVWLSVLRQRKAQYLKAAAELLDSEFDGDIPVSVSDLCRLPGVGPKMAHLTMNIAWRQICGIGAWGHWAATGQ